MNLGMGIKEEEKTINGRLLFSEILTRQILVTVGRYKVNGRFGGRMGY